MKWTIEYLEKDAIVAAKINGVMGWNEHKKFAEEIFPFGRKKKANKILLDFREMTPDFTLLEVDDLPKMLKEIGVSGDIKIAAIHDMASPKASEHTFFKNTANILSLNVEIFSNRNDAISWLKAGSPDIPKKG